MIVSGQQLLRIDSEDTSWISSKIEDNFICYLNQSISKFDVIVLSDYSKGVLSESLCMRIIKMANDNNIKTIVDPKGADFRKFANVFLFKPNKKEAISMIGDHKMQIESLCQELKNEINAQNIIITLAEDGMACLSDEFVIVPTISAQIYDVSGAGDTVLASFAICCAKNIPIELACIFANAAASIVISQIGSCVTTIDLVLKQINNEFRFN